jgi:hypothetical protein
MGDTLRRSTPSASRLTAISLLIDPLSGTPRARAMHVVERYRLFDGAAAGRMGPGKFRESPTRGLRSAGGGSRTGFTIPPEAARVLQPTSPWKTPKTFKNIALDRAASPIGGLSNTTLTENVCADIPVDH